MTEVIPCRLANLDSRRHWWEEIEKVPRSDLVEHALCSLTWKGSKRGFARSLLLSPGMKAFKKGFREVRFRIRGDKRGSACFLQSIGTWIEHELLGKDRVLHKQTATLESKLKEVRYHIMYKTVGTWPSRFSNTNTRSARKSKVLRYLRHFT